MYSITRSAMELALALVNQELNRLAEVSTGFSSKAVRQAKNRKQFNLARKRQELELWLCAH
jgi:hypothetical protein